MADLRVFHATWNLLLAIHPLFNIKPPGSNSEGTGTDFRASLYREKCLLLRGKFIQNIVKQQQLSLDDVVAKNIGIEELQSCLCSMMEQLEGMVDPSIGEREGLELTIDLQYLSRFPRLVTLRKLLQTSQSAALGDSPIDTTATDTKLHSLEEGSSEAERHRLGTKAQAKSYIQYPNAEADVDSCSTAAGNWTLMLEKIMGGSIDMLSKTILPVNYSSRERAIVRYAADFASACTSLFRQLVETAKCGNQHQVELHLSGFEEGQLRLIVNTCQNTNWIPIIFKRCSEESNLPLQNEFKISQICSDFSFTQEPQSFVAAFNSGGIWKHQIDRTMVFTRNQPRALDYLLQHDEHLNGKHKGLIRVLLALSLFQLCGSPWVTQRFGLDNIFASSPHYIKQEIKRLDHWCPQLVCTLAHKENTKLEGEDVAALGILILELEAGRKAPSPSPDECLVQGEGMTYLRLGQALGAWEGVVSDRYRSVAKACLEFHSRAIYTDDKNIASERPDMAYIFRHILEPLLERLLEDFGALKIHFKGIIDLWNYLSAGDSSLKPSKHELFDDTEVSCGHEDIESAKSFFDDLEPLGKKLFNIRQETSTLYHHDKIRIAILDSGVYQLDRVIERAIADKRINTAKSRSFVGSSYDWSDSLGHGTHVTRLLLKVAPAAEIFILKICVGKTLKDNEIPGIAKAISWAVDECNAHIISLSFGFETRNDAIDEEIDKAVSKGKLVIAAAANRGGVADRARPARRDDVICVHASDGKGNSGKMNPSPKENAWNYSTLGVAVRSRWNSQEVWKSGTSFATPILAGFAAAVLEFANYRCKLSKKEFERLNKKQGMDLVLQKMAEKRDGYHFIHPGRLWREWETGKKEEDAARMIKSILDTH